MKYNQFSYIPSPLKIAIQEMLSLGFEISTAKTDKENLEVFARRFFFQYTDTAYPIANLIADFVTDLLTFFKSDIELTIDIFKTIQYFFDVVYPCTFHTKILPYLIHFL